MGEEKNSSVGKTDKWYNKVMGYLTGQISKFVAFLYLVMAIGIVIGGLVITKTPHLFPIVVGFYAVSGLIAYYNRDIATILFVLFLIFFIFL